MSAAYIDFVSEYRKQRREQRPDLQRKEDMSRTAREQTNMSPPNSRPMNGHARSPARRSKQDDDDQTNENIFLFVPNLIGAPSKIFKCKTPTNRLLIRLLSNCSCVGITLLHAPPPAPM